MDLARVNEEIEEEVRRKRASGELTAEFERELDAVFAKFAPTGALDGNFDQLLVRAEQQAFVDLLAPNESAKPVVPQVKRVIQKSIRWYLRYMADQLTGFGHTVTRLLRLMDDRVKLLENGTVSRDLRAGVRYTNVWSHWEKPILQAVKGQEGRILHADCGNGDLVRKLGANAYGITTKEEFVRAAAQSEEALDLRSEHLSPHLAKVKTDALGAVVITDLEHLRVGAQTAFTQRIFDALRPGGKLAMVTASPEAFQRRNATEVDLASGHPLRDETWQYVLESQGYTDVAIQQQAGTPLLQVPKDADAITKANWALLNERFGMVESIFITATKR